ncbi:hypothetical protein BQ8482_220009 [Mesorhizobium delmotii]|uniref:Uncharacterized protein n=1 Tax=Mesorhizobium delmotii TaxID=1631247 RepID=A0A2P9AL11_9HYPH|nr:hypothetical protein BQ8482_220009 [Mesorhizobium delmotii]
MRQERHILENHPHCPGTEFSHLIFGLPIDILAANNDLASAGFDQTIHMSDQR